MRKIILMMLLAGVSSSAAAEWFQVDKSNTFTVYADAATIRRSGNMVKMWNLLDFKTAEKNLVTPSKPYLSERTQQEYDCNDERYRLLYLSHHSENMGNGEVVFADSDPSNWSPVPPQSIVEILWKLACGKQ